MTNKCCQPKGKYLEHRVRTRVRFQEVDSIQIVWHGHYLTYFEDARAAFGRQYGLSYADILEAGVTAPIVHVSCDYLGPAGCDDDLEILIRLIRAPGAKLEFYYEVSRPADGALLARGRTTQAFADLDGKLVLTTPKFLKDFYRHWEGSMSADEE